MLILIIIPPLSLFERESRWDFPEEKPKRNIRMHLGARKNSGRRGGNAVKVAKARQPPTIKGEK